MMVKSSLFQRKHWVFDLDGTLTVPVHDFDGIRKQLGLPEKCDILATIDSLPQPQGAELKNQLDEIELDLARNTKMAKGADDLLVTLSEKGCSLGILTRNSKENAWISLKAMGLTPFFEKNCVLGREDAIFKPDPDGILQLAALWNVPPHALVMVGDYLYDLKAGQAAGVTTVHVDRTAQFIWPEWMDYGVQNLKELHGHLISNKPSL